MSFITTDLRVMPLKTLWGNKELLAMPTSSFDLFACMACSKARWPLDPEQQASPSDSLDCAYYRSNLNDLTF